MFEYFFVSFWALGAAAASSIGFPTMHCQIGFPIIILLKMLPNDVLGNHASRSSDCHRHLNGVLAIHASQTYICWISFPLSSSRSTRHMPSFATKILGEAAKQQQSKAPAAQQGGQELPKVLAKCSLKFHTCQICIPNGACQVYLQFVRLPSMHSKWCLPNISSYHIFAKNASQMVLAKYIFKS